MKNIILFIAVVLVFTACHSQSGKRETITTAKSLETTPDTLYKYRVEVEGITYVIGSNHLYKPGDKIPVCFQGLPVLCNRPGADRIGLILE